jgi:excisionase family DNA binding protein
MKTRSNMLTVKQAALQLGVCASLVYSWCRSGMLPHFRLGATGKRGGIRIAEADLDGFLAEFKREGRRETPPPPRAKAHRLTHLHLPS